MIDDCLVLVFLTQTLKTRPNRLELLAITSFHSASSSPRHDLSKKTTNRELPIYVHTLILIHWLHKD